MNSLEIRQKFFDFFTKNGHTLVASSSLIPAEDPTLLFTNAGMNQFKDVFLGAEKRSYTRAVSIQKCIRAGGKHNDLENVGFTKRHLTFFEMMGNFSFGDYFKEDAIKFAWAFITQEIKLPIDTLYATVFTHDDEAYEIWHTLIGLPKERIVRLGAADNFWQMGDTGPCGPCSEIYIDRGIAFGCNKQTCAPGCSCDRFLEFWNLVFMQFDRQPDGTDVPLAKTGVDTGMGLERLCAIIQNKDSVFEIDIFAGIIAATERITGIDYAQADLTTQGAFKVLADHIRSSCFAIADGCTPAAEGRGYVLRKIIRRAALFAQKLGSTEIFQKLAPALIDEMGKIYPELTQRRDFIIAILTSEIEKFSHNLVHGQAILEKYFESAPHKKLSGDQAFKLYDTYGFPLELTQVIAQERGFTVDAEGFGREMEKQRMQSGKKEAAQIVVLDPAIITEFVGYTQEEITSTITALLVDGQLVDTAPQGARCFVVTKQTPFYVECGGQISDQGFITRGTSSAPLLSLKKIGHAIAAEILAPCALELGNQVDLLVDTSIRTNTRKNHTATHLLQAALMTVVGKQIKQAGSIVTPEYLRFDFTHHENLTGEQITQVEALINQQIMYNIPVNTTVSTHKAAVDRGVIAFFGEKYNPENVRVVEIPGFSAELCGGTHVRATGDIGCFKIIETVALSAGNRRIVAVTGPKALAEFQTDFAIVKKLCQDFKVQTPHLLDALAQQRSTLKLAQNKIKELKKQVFLAQVPQWLTQVKNVGALPFLYLKVADAGVDELKEIAMMLLKNKPACYFLVSSALFYVTCAPEFVAQVDMKALAAWLKTYGLQGGTSAVAMQGGGNPPPNFESLLIGYFSK